MTYQRGRVYAATIDRKVGEKYFLVVSNNSRNRQLESALAIRLTTSPKPPLTSIVELSHDEVFTGRALCDDIEVLYDEDEGRDIGAVDRRTMVLIEHGLKAALDLS